MGIPLVSEVADFFAALASGRDIGAVRGPTLFVVLHSVLLGCLCRPCVDARPDGKGPRHWLASLALFLTYILGGTTVTAALLGLRPCWMVDDRVWLFYALGWLLAGLLPVRRLVLQSPAKVCDSSFSQLLLLLYPFRAIPRGLTHISLHFPSQIVFALAHALIRVSFVSGAVIAADTACPRALLAAIFVPVFNSHGMDWLTTPVFLALEGRPLVPCTDWLTPSPFVFPSSFLSSSSSSSSLSSSQRTSKHVWCGAGVLRAERACVGRGGDGRAARVARERGARRAARRRRCRQHVPRPRRVRVGPARAHLRPPRRARAPPPRRRQPRVRAASQLPLEKQGRMRFPSSLTPSQSNDHKNKMNKNECRLCKSLC